MISDKSLAWVCLGITVVGIVSLFFIVQLIEPLTIGAGEISRELDGQAVVTEGIISSFNEKDGNVFLTLNDELKVVMFKSQAEDSIVYELEGHEKISVTGKVSIYRDELEVIAEKIELI